MRTDDDVTTPYFVYMVKCRDGTLYTGITNDIAARVDAHNRDRGARYTRGRGPVHVVFLDEQASKGHALKLEHAIKRLSRDVKQTVCVE